MKVICNKKDFCSEAPLCGGSKPHEKCVECGLCPRDTTAECVPYQPEKESAIAADIEAQRKADWELDEVHPPELRAFE